MVGIVLVSHSKELALSTRNLAIQAAPRIPIAAVGGTGENGQEFGTDAITIMEAIESVHSEEGVLLLMDMGSALLSAETALDLLGEDIATNVRLCSAPFVEGAVAAAVQSSIGADLDSVTQESLKGLAGKQEQLDETEESSNSPGSLTPSEIIPPEAIQRQYTIQARNGLHARPVAKLVQTAAKFKSKIWLNSSVAKHQPVSALSLNSIVKLNIRQGETLIAYASGDDAEAFLNTLEELNLREFGEREISGHELISLKQKLKTIPETTPEEVLKSSSLIGISGGMAIGQAWKITVTDAPKFLSNTVFVSKEKELQILNTLLELASNTLKSDLKQLKDETSQTILEMHQVMMRDPDLLSRSETYIQSGKQLAEQAWYIACMDVAKEYQAFSDNKLLQARADDIKDLANRVLKESARIHHVENAQAPEQAILFVNETTPGLMATLDFQRVKGIVSVQGGTTSHAAIMARSLGIPMLGGFNGIAGIPEGTCVVLDGNSAQLIIDPAEDVISDFRNRIKNAVSYKKIIQEQSQNDALSTDEVSMECTANIGAVKDASFAIEFGASGIGLFRSEFLFLGRSSAPDEEEQFQAYTQVLSQMKNFPVIVRTLDIGGDKTIPYLSQPKENNPFLGVRGIRFTLKHQDMFRIQLRALLRAGLYGNLKVMLPMVVDLNEIRAVREIIADCREDLLGEGKKIIDNLPLGIMIETPASVLNIDRLATESDFFSVGTNDLTQYILAAERDNNELSALNDPCHPAVLTALKMIADSEQSSRIPLSVCGEAASDFATLPILMGMGYRRFSISPGRVPTIKFLIRSLSVRDCENQLNDIHKLEDAKSVRELVLKRFPQAAELTAIM